LFARSKKPTTVQPQVRSSAAGPNDPQSGPQERKILASDPDKNKEFQIIPKAKRYEHLHYWHAASVIPQPKH
jgi:hypothetical protein